MTDAELLEHLKQYLSYDLETGIFTWIKTTSFRVKVGKKAGSTNDQGYILIRFNKIFYRAHRLAWLFVYGKFPNKFIDHVNGIRHDNRISNLKDVSRRENQCNSKIHRNGRLAGCVWKKDKNKWWAKIEIKNKTKHIGYFNSELEAHQSYLTYCKENNL